MDPPEDEFEARRQDQVPTAEIPTRPLRDRGGRAHTPTTPVPPRRLGDTTQGFGAVLPVPGQDRTHVEGAGPLTTVDFGAVLPVPSAPTVSRGDRIDDFLIGEALDEAPALTVYAAEHPTHGACRLMLYAPGAAQHAQGILLDARLRTTLRDPRLARVHAVGALPRPWIALEPTSGEALGGGLGRLRSDVVGRVVVEAALALATLHEKRVVHGDLTPGDLVVSGDRVRVEGIGRPTRIDDAGCRRSHPGGADLGAAYYSAPELFDGERPTPSSDVYSLGAILYQGVAGLPPHRGTASEVKRGALDRLPVRPRLDVGSLEEALVLIAERCLAKEPRDRYPTARGLAAALRAALDVRHAAEEPPPSRGGPLVFLLLLVLALAVVAAWALL